MAIIRYVFRLVNLIAVFTVAFQLLGCGPQASNLTVANIPITMCEETKDAEVGLPGSTSTTVGYHVHADFGPEWHTFIPCMLDLRKEDFK